MRTAICTISTHSHLYKADALFHSLRGKTDARFINLITDYRPNADVDVNGTVMRGLDSLTVPNARPIITKYRGDALRWGCKPLLIGQLLQEGYDKVIYVDNDIYFYSSPGFLFDMLDEHAVLLTPHHYPADPAQGQEWLEANFRVGLYNAGFIAAGQRGAKAIEWWAGCCAYAVCKSGWRGLFDDQKYLDLMPVLFDGVHVMRHKGCNVAGWNISTCPRSIADDGLVVIDGEKPLVFVHYNTFTLRMAYFGKDPEIALLAQQYVEQLQRHRPGLTMGRLAWYTVADVADMLRHVLWRFQRAFTG